MPVAGDRAQLVVGALAVARQQSDVGRGIGRTGQFLLLHEMGRWPDAAAARQRKLQVVAPGGDGFVGFVHQAIAEQCMVVIARCRLHRKHHQPRGVPVDAVDRHQCLQPEPAFQPHQQCFLQVSARGNDRQEMRFVHHQQMRVLKQQHFVERNPRFRRQAAVVIHLQPALVGPQRGYYKPCFVDHRTVVHALHPDVARLCGEALHQKVGDGGPWPFGQRNTARADTIAGRQGGFQRR